MSKVHKYSVQWVCTTTGAPGPASPTLGPAHTHTLTVAHTVALTPYSTDEICRAERGDVAKALNRCTTRSSAQMRNLRRQAHDTQTFSASGELLPRGPTVGSFLIETGRLD